MKVLLLVGNVVFVGLGLSNESYMSRPTLALCAFAAGVLLIRIIEDME